MRYAEPESQDCDIRASLCPHSLGPALRTSSHPRRIFTASSHSRAMMGHELLRQFVATKGHKAAASHDGIQRGTGRSHALGTLGIWTFKRLRHGSMARLYPSSVSTYVGPGATAPALHAIRWRGHSAPRSRTISRTRIGKEHRVTQKDVVLYVQQPG